jgi:TolA-binding protein
MKKLILSWFIFSPFFVFATGCLDTRDDIREQEDKHALQTQVVSLQRNTADQSARYQDIQEELRALTGRIEVMETQMSQLSSRQQKGDDDGNKRTADLQEKIKLLADTVSVLQNQMNELQQQALAAQAAAEQQEQETKVNKETAHTSSGKAQLELGNKEFDKKNWKKAIVAFEKYRSANPKGKSYANATLKIGQSFQELAMNQEARAFYEEVVTKYPKSDEAKKAASRLKKLK